MLVFMAGDAAWVFIRRLENSVVLLQAVRKRLAASKLYATASHPKNYNTQAAKRGWFTRVGWEVLFFCGCLESVFLGCGFWCRFL